MHEEDKDPNVGGAGTPDELAAAAETAPGADLEEAARERDQFRALAQRTQADFVNYKRRMDEDRAMLTRTVSMQLVLRLLPTLDDLQRAIAHLPAEAPASWSEGVEMIARNLQALVESEGVASFEPMPGDTFDPAEHEAVYFQPSGDQPAGAVLSMVRPGYRTADRVLRAAQVIVAQAVTDTTDAQGAEN